MQAFRCFLVILLFLSSCSNQAKKNKPRVTPPKKPTYKEWTTLTPGMEYKEMLAPKKSFIGDSKLSILRMDPSLFQFDVYAATQYDSKPRTLKAWANKFDLVVAFNSGMYSVENPLQSRAYLQAGRHKNNSKLIADFNLMLAMGPKPNSNRSNIEVLDLTCSEWDIEKHNFAGFAQGLRMIDCNASPMYWQKKIQSCSMLVAAEDEEGRFYLIFTRSPYTHNQMIDFILDMPGGLHDVIYLEGGPEACLLIDVDGQHIEKIGSWVSETWESDGNRHFWELPNIIGVRKK